MLNKYFKNCSTSLVTGKCKLKLFRDQTSFKSERPSLRKHMSTNVLEDVEKEKSLLLMGLKIGAATLKISMEFSQTTKYKTTTSPCYTHPGHVPKEPYILSQRYL